MSECTCTMHLIIPIPNYYIPCNSNTTVILYCMLHIQCPMLCIIACTYHIPYPAIFNLPTNAHIISYHPRPHHHYNNSISISSHSTHPPKPTSSRIPLGLISKPLQIPTLGQSLDQLHTKRKIIMPPPLILILPLLPQLLLFHQL